MASTTVSVSALLNFPEGSAAQAKFSRAETETGRRHQDLRKDTPSFRGGEMPPAL